MEVGEFSKNLQWQALLVKALRGRLVISAYSFIPVMVSAGADLKKKNILIHSLLTFQDRCVFDCARLLKPNVSGRKVQI